MSERDPNEDEQRAREEMDSAIKGFFEGELGPLEDQTRERLRDLERIESHHQEMLGWEGYPPEIAQQAEEAIARLRGEYSRALQEVDRIRKVLGLPPTSNG